MADDPRLLTQVTEAFVDRAPIDWTALLSRVRASPDRAVVENLYLLDAMRGAAPIAGRARKRAPPTMFLARLMVAVAALQTACSGLVVGIAIAGGVTLVDRTPQAVLAVAFATATCLIGGASSGDPRRLFLLATFASVASAFSRHMLTGLPETWGASIGPIVRGIVPEALAPACLWQFALDFPRVRRFTFFDVLARRVAAAAWLMGVSLFSVNLAAAYSVIDSEGSFAYFLRHHPSHLFWDVFAIGLIAPVIAIFVRSRRAASSDRRKVLRFAFAIAAGTAPYLSFSVVWAVSPRFYAWYLTAGPECLWLDRVILAALTATPILCTAAVLVDRPFERPLADRRTSRLFLDATSRVIDTFERCVLRQAGDRHERLAHAMEQVRRSRGAREIAVVLARELRLGIGAKSVRVLVPEREGIFVDAATGASSLATDGVLVAMLAESPMPLDLASEESALALLPRADRAWVIANDVALAAAVKQRDETVAAIVVCGRKRNGLPYDRRDRWFVTTVTAAAAAAWGTAGIRDEAAAASHEHWLADLGEAAFECPRCGVVSESRHIPCNCSADAVLASLPHRVADKFVLQRRIGAGGMGVVYLARDIILDRDVALKTLPAMGPGAVPQLREEARAMAALNHDSLATIFGLEIWRRTPVLVVEYFPEGTLAHRLRRAALPFAAVIDLGIRLARALTFMHAKGMLHRDLKPNNIAFTATGTIKLLDFGLATLRRPSSGEEVGPWRNGAEMYVEPAGTYAYLPPEAYRGVPPAPSFDLWALSVVLLEATIGVNPFSAPDRDETIHRVTMLDLSPTIAGIEARYPALGAFFARALDRDPERRFDTSLDINAALEMARATAPAGQTS